MKMAGVWKFRKAFGEGPEAFWGRSDFEARTFPSDCALQDTLGPFQWGRSPVKKPTFPKTPGDLPHHPPSRKKEVRRDEV